MKPKPRIKRFKPSGVWRAAGVRDPHLWGVFLTPQSRKPVAASRDPLSLSKAKVFKDRRRKKFSGEPGPDVPF